MNARISKFLLLSKDFGIPFAFKYYFYRERKNYCKHIKLVYDKMSEILKDQVCEYNKITEIPRGEHTNVIWMCWWQGYDSMPTLCKMCFKQLRSILPSDYKIILITQDNYREYVQIPDHILNKVKSGTLSITNFSDILRQALIYYNGGTWVDASLWTNERLISSIENNLNFWSVKLTDIDDPAVWGQLISECKWSSFLLSGEKGNLVCKFVYEAMSKYFESHVSTIDYFLQNVVIRIAYEQIPLIHEIIESVPVSNIHLYELYRHMDEKYNETLWNEMCLDTGAFKLTQKRPYKEEVGGKQTFYGYLKERCEL